MATSTSCSPHLLCFLLLSLSVLSLSQRCHPNDKKALLQIKRALNASSNIFATWNKDTGCCGWKGLKCDVNTHRITSIVIGDDNGVSGQIPAAVGDLPFLKELILDNFPKLTGPIQPTIAKLTSLKFFWIRNTSVSGPIPSFVGDLKNLSTILFSFNQLTGTIPPSFSKLTKLAILGLQGNKLTGRIPGSFARLSTLDLTGNQFTGPIPESFRNSKDVDRLVLTGNKFSGDASHVFGSKKKGYEVDLSRNMFEFDLTKVVFSESLVILDLSHNKIFGSLPKGVEKTHWQIFNVSFNRLCGKIPSGGSGQLQVIGESAFVNNKCLCGAPLAPCK